MNDAAPRYGIVQVDNARLQELLDAGVVLVDVRRPEEWHATGIVAGSRLLTFFDRHGHSDPAAWLRQLAEFSPPGAPLALICRTGHRTGMICDFLLETTGYRTLYNVAGGIHGWLAEKRPVAAVES
jgi:rhodanese-related sulfurtransferase